MQSVKLDERTIHPSKIICIGRNYAAHIEELNNEVPTEPVIFLKPNSSIGSEIYSSESDAIHYEGEITFLIRDSRLSGVGFGLDLTKRELQQRLKAKGLPWERAKSFDNAAVFSRFVTFKGDVADLHMELHINNRLVQKGDVNLMLSKPCSLLEEVKSFITLEDGDLLMTGTPEDVGPVKAGARFHGKIFAKKTLLVEGIWTVK